MVGIPRPKLGFDVRSWTTSSSTTSCSRSSSSAYVILKSHRPLAFRQHAGGHPRERAPHEKPGLQHLGSEVCGRDRRRASSRAWPASSSRSSREHGADVRVAGDVGLAHAHGDHGWSRHTVGTLPGCSGDRPRGALFQHLPARQVAADPGGIFVLCVMLLKGGFARYLSLLWSKIGFVQGEDCRRAEPADVERSRHDPATGRRRIQELRRPERSHRGRLCPRAGAEGRADRTQRGGKDHPPQRDRRPTPRLGAATCGWTTSPSPRCRPTSVFTGTRPLLPDQQPVLRASRCLDNVLLALYGGGEVALPHGRHALERREDLLPEAERLLDTVGLWDRDDTSRSTPCPTETSAW